jgi:hypothetical protein
MRLKLVSVRGYKRFAQQSKLDTRGPLIAIVGPNEAGKTSLLETMEHISSGDAFDAREFTRGTAIDEKRWVVEAHFSLEQADRELLGDLIRPDLDLTYKRTVYPRGNATYYMEPWMPRDLTWRDRAAAALREAVDDGWLESLDAPEEAVEDPEQGTRLHEQAQVLADELAARDDWLSDHARDELSALGTAIEAHDTPTGRKTKRSALLGALAEASQHEREDPIHKKINAILAPRVPEVLLFREKHRALETEYPWADNQSPPDALANLFALAKTDYPALRGQ